MDFESQSAQKVAALVRFNWGLGHVTRYTTWDEDITLGDTSVWTSEPRMEVNPQKVDGSIRDIPWRVRMIARAPIDKLLRPFAHPPVTCWIGVVDLADLTTTKAKWAGPVTKTVSAPDGLAGVVDVEVSGWKSLIQYPTGMEVSERCGNVFGLSPCEFDIAARRRSGTVTAVSGYTVTFSGDVSIPAGFTAYWESGSMRFDGLDLKILGRSDHAFRLDKLPPPEWLGQTVEIEPGCMKLIKNCRERAQEHHFNGTGIATPAYDPTIDDPTGTTG